LSHQLTLYYRSGCSLCEEMHRELAEGNTGHDFSLESVDVDSDPVLIKAYGHKVPVLVASDGDEICHYFLDRDALDSYFLTH